MQTVKLMIHIYKKETLEQNKRSPKLCSHGNPPKPNDHTFLLIEHEPFIEPFILSTHFYFKQTDSLRNFIFRICIERIVLLLQLIVFVCCFFALIFRRSTSRFTK